MLLVVFCIGFGLVEIERGESLDFPELVCDGVCNALVGKRALLPAISRGGKAVLSCGCLVLPKPFSGSRVLVSVFFDVENVSGLKVGEILEP